MNGWTLARAAEAVRRGEASSVELTKECLDGLERLQPALRLSIRMDPDDAMRQARKMDARRAKGGRLGPLHGVPLAHKDVFDRRGKVTTCGSKIRAHHVASATAPVIRRLDHAGAIDLGRLNMAEFAAGGTGHNAHWGDCLNPWNPQYTPGGSSSGSAAAVAARAVYGSLGTDTGGSLRWPAALCGVTALRPTQGRLRMEGVAPRAWSLDTVGPIARTAEDCALLFDVLCGSDSWSAAESGAKDVRIAVPRSAEWTANVTAEHKSALEESLAVFRSLGAKVIEVDVPDPDVGFRLGDLIVRAEAAALHGTWLRERPNDYAPGIRTQLESGLAVPAMQYIDALRLRPILLDEFLLAVFAHADVLHVPVHPHPAPTMADCEPHSVSAVTAFWAAYPRFTRPFSFLGLPALSLPCGIASSGIPIGCQLVAPPMGEARLLRAAHAFQGATTWHLRSPPISRVQ